MAKKFDEQPAGAPKPGIQALLSSTRATSPPASVTGTTPLTKADVSSEDPEEYILKSFYMKNKHINAIMNLVHLKKVQGESLIGQKEVVDMILTAGIKAMGPIPERPDAIKTAEKARSRRK